MNLFGDKSLGSFEQWGPAPAYVFPRGYRHERWSYQQVAGVAYQFARELALREIEKGDAVLLWAPNCAEWVAAFLGCALSGVIAVPVDDASAPDFARRISRQVRTKLVLCSRERASQFEGIVTLDPANLATTIAEHPSARYRPIAIDPSDTLEIVFTSGTTAEPKGVVLSHANVAGNLEPIAAEIEKYRKYEHAVHPLRFLNLLPLSHVFGQFLGIFIPPLLGATVVFENTFNPAGIIETIHRERVSVLVAVPRLIDSLKRKIERDVEDSGLHESFTSQFKKASKQHFLRRWWTFRAIRRRFGWKFLAMISGGAALDRETEEFWHRLGYAVVQGYGLTETTSLISLNHPFHTSRGSIGKVLPGRELRLAEDGEILVRGTGVASSYWSDRERKPVSGEEGWYRTGDLGALDAQGNLFFKGRKKEVIVTPAGMNIYPQDLEAALRLQPAVRDCIVVGLERGGNAEPCAVLILRDHSAADAEKNAAEQVVARTNESLAEYQRMRSWFLWPEEDFPRSSTQKPRRNIIRDAVEAALRGRSLKNAAASPLSELIAKVTGRPIPSLDPGANLETQLGLSSLERVDLLSALEDRYQIDLSETAFAQAATVANLEKLLHGSSPQIGIAANGQPASQDPEMAQSRVEAPHRSFHYPGWTLRWPATWVRLAAHYLFTRPAVFLLGQPRVTGRENISGISGPFLVVSNHVANVDIGLIQTVLPPNIRHKIATATSGEALEALHSPAPTRNPLFKIYDRLLWVLGVTLLNLFPLPRQSGFRKSFAYAGDAVDRGYSILVFPEGRYTEDGKVGVFRTGVGLLANNLRIPVLPMRIDGLFEVKRAGRRFTRPGRIQIRIGKPVQFQLETSPEEIARELQRVVESL